MPKDVMVSCPMCGGTGEHPFSMMRNAKCFVCQGAGALDLVELNRQLEAAKNIFAPAQASAYQALWQLADNALSDLIALSARQPHAADCGVFKSPGNCTCYHLAADAKVEKYLADLKELRRD